MRLEHCPLLEPTMPRKWPKAKALRLSGQLFCPNAGLIGKSPQKNFVESFDMKAR